MRMADSHIGCIEMLCDSGSSVEVFSSMESFEEWDWDQGCIADTSSSSENSDELVISGVEVNFLSDQGIFYFR